MTASNQTVAVILLVIYQVDLIKYLCYIITMNLKTRITGIIRDISLILLFLIAHPLAGQQAGSVPLITLVSPITSDTLNYSGLALIKAEIVSKVPLQSYRIYNNEETVVNESAKKLIRNNSGTFVLENLLPLNKGLNTIYLEVKNANGQGSSEKRNIACQLEPFVSWLLPSQVNSTIESGKITIKAEIKTGFDLQNLNLNINGNQLADEKAGTTRLSNDTYSFEKTIQLSSGRNTIFISAGNLKGRSKSQVRNINYVLGLPPVITMMSPERVDSLNYSGLVLVKAQIISKSGLQTFSLLNNDKIIVDQSSNKLEQKDSISYVMESLVPLERGENNLHIYAKNAFGTARPETRTIICQAAPFVSWLLPASVNSTTETEKFTLRAEIKTGFDLQNVFIYINGTRSADEKAGISRLTNDKYIIEKTIQLNAGKNSIYIASSNIRGAGNSTTRYINYSLGSAPIINLTGPSAKDTLNNKGLALLKAEIVSKSPIQTYSIFTNDEAVVNETAKTLMQKDSITYILESFVPLKRNQNIIHLEVKNIFGSTSSEKRTIYSQPEPFISWIEPAYDNPEVKSGKLYVKAEMKSGFELKNIKLYINDTPTAVELSEITQLNNDTYLFEKTIQLDGGKSTIYISAANLKGISNSIPRYISFSTGSEPVITFISPTTADSLNNSGIATVSAEIVSPTGLQTFRLFNNRTIVLNETSNNLEKKDSVTYVIKSFVPLQTGSNTVFIEAKNIIGTTRSEKHIIKCQLEPIIKWVLPATSSTTSASGMVTVKAEIITSFDLTATKINLNGNVLLTDKESLKRLNNETYLLEKSIPFNAGANNIFIIADNIRGTGYSNKRTINYEPVFVSEIKWIVPGDLNSDVSRPEFSLSATIRTRSAIKSTRLYINGLELLPADKSKITQKDQIEYLYENTCTLKPGTNIVELSAITDAGIIISTEKRTINYRVPALPVFSWNDPSAVQSVVERASMDIRLKIKSAGKPDNISVFLNGKALSNENLVGNIKKENDYFMLESTVSLQPGDNKIYVVAGNSAGNSTSETRNIKYIIPSKPVIIWGSPETTISSISTSSVTIRANITSTTDLQNLQIFQNDKLLPDKPVINTTDKQRGEYSVEKILTLDQGANRIYFVADNTSGSSTSETRSINYVTPVAPVVTWISPSKEKNDINLNSAKIRATLKSVRKLQSLLVYVNDVASEEVDQISSAAPTGEYTIEKSINLNPGENSVYLVATSADGTTKSEYRYLTNPMANPPLISWASPIDPAALVNSELIVIEACIKSAVPLKSALVFVNGIQQVSELVFQQPQEGDCSYRLTKPILLKEGENSVYIFAANAAGSTPSDKRLITFNKAVTEKRLALVIGNAEYGSKNPLKNPVNDANLMEGTLQSLGFKVIKKLNANLADMKAVIREFSQQMKNYNVALFYYAGHGIQVSENNYLIPTDAKLENKEDCKWEAFAINDILEEFTKYPENINIVILDACRSNPYRSWVRGDEAGFKPIMNNTSGLIIAFATAIGSTAADGSGENGLYTEELVKQMNIPQPIESVFKNTRVKVLQKSKGTQKPTETTELNGDFYFKK